MRGGLQLSDWRWRTSIFWVGAIFILIGCGVSVTWFTVGLIHMRPDANYVLVGLGFLLLVIGILPYTGESPSHVNVKRLGIARICRQSEFHIISTRTQRGEYGFKPTYRWTWTYPN